MEIIANKYRVLKKLGAGAMGDVYLVMPPRGDPVALKLLKTLDSKSNKEAIEQFENEFKVLKKLAHPNIGKIYDYGFEEEQQKVFFTLPWLKGTDIYAATDDRSFEVCEDLFVQTLRALNYLHQKNLIHCDLKPGNIYVENGHVILIDFGLAGYWGENIVGTPTYLAPEIYRGAHHNVASDLYACGVICYNCLSRTQPFSGKNLQEVFDRHSKFCPPPLSELEGKVPKYFSDIVEMLLNKKPEERFQSAAAVIEDIAAFSKKNYPVETEETLLSYLPTSSELIGHKEGIQQVERALSDFLSENETKPYHLILIHGPKGVGKSQIVVKIKNDLQLAKVTVEAAQPPFNEHDRMVLGNARGIVLEDLNIYLHDGPEQKHLQEFIELIEEKILSTITSRMLLVLTGIAEDDFAAIVKLFPEEESALTMVELAPYSREETREFLVTVIGQKEIPKTFVDQFYRNTGGLPVVGQQLIQSMIEKGLLFDASGRWNEDLLGNLEKALEKVQISESLEQEFEKVYDSLSDQEEEIVNWLAVCPHMVSGDTLAKLTGFEGLPTLLAKMTTARVLREETAFFALYRTVFQNFVEGSLPDKDVARRHTLLALPKNGVEKKWAIYHLSLGSDRTLAVKATARLADLYEREGERDKACESYQRLIREFGDEPITERLAWHIRASTLLIWLDRFKEAEETLTVIEREIIRTKPKVDYDLFLTLMEKKGLALLHQEKIDDAVVYFQNGLKRAENKAEHVVHKLRFENNLAQIEVVKGHPEEAVRIFEKTRKESKSLTLESLHKITNNDLGHIYLQQRAYVSALHILSEDIRIFSTMKNHEPLARGLYSYAGALRAQGDNDKAIQAYNECIVLSKHGHFFSLLLRIYNGLGNLYMSLANHEEALKCYQKGVEISVRLQAISLKAALLINQGRIYHRENNAALATRRFLMAKQVLENKLPKLAFDDLLLSMCYKELAGLATVEKNSMKALSYQLERMKLVDHSETLRPEKFSVMLDLGELYLQNRLKEQFFRQMQELGEAATTVEEKEKVVSLRKRWEEIEGFSEQNSTSRLSG